MEAGQMRDSRPEYYDGEQGKYIGKHPQLFQSWSVVGCPNSKNHVHARECTFVQSFTLNWE